MSKLKIGDKVIIREDLECKQYGLNTAVSYMLKYAGQEATIRGYVSTKIDNYHLDIDDGQWAWDINMFEYTAENKDVHKEHEYQIGDKVKIHEHLTLGTYGDLDLVQDMAEYLGMEAEIVDIDADGDFTLDVDGGKYWWNEEMVCPLNKASQIDFEGEYFRLIEVVSEYEDIIDELEDELKESELNNLIITEKYNSLVHEYNNLIDLHTHALVENAKLKKKTTI